MARRAGTRVAPRPPKAFGPASGRVGTVAVPTEFGPALNVTALTPPQVASLYDYPVTPGAAGQTIGLIEFGGGFAQGDLNQFFSGLGGGLTAPTPTVVGMDGVTNNPGVDINEDGEVTLDICVASSVASNADVAVYFAPWTEQGWVDVITSAVHDATNNPSVLSISWGWPEFEGIEGFTWTQQAINAVNQTFQDAAALGVTVFAASGDSGSDCGQGDGAAHVLYPASDPFVSSCGGTRISDVSGASFTETTWAQSFGTTGGGISDFFSLPTYQIGAGVPLSANDGHQGRGIPDIAGNADPASGYNLIVDGSSFPGVGGTSATAPLYAALVALCNARLGRSVGFLNPLLYALNNTGVIRDIADNASNATGGAPGYIAGPGWDAATGLGVVDGQGLLAALTARFTKEVTIITDRSTFGKDEIDAMLQVSNPAVIDAAFYVTVDGFTPAELGITTTNPTPTQLQSWAPAFTRVTDAGRIHDSSERAGGRAAVAARAAAAVHVRVPGRVRQHERVHGGRHSGRADGDDALDVGHGGDRPHHAPESLHRGRSGLVAEHGRSRVPAAGGPNAGRSAGRVDGDRRQRGEFVHHEHHRRVQHALAVRTSVRPHLDRRRHVEARAVGEGERHAGVQLRRGARSLPSAVGRRDAGARVLPRVPGVDDVDDVRRVNDVPQRGERHDEDSSARHGRR